MKDGEKSIIASRKKRGSELLIFAATSVGLYARYRSCALCTYAWLLNPRRIRTPSQDASPLITSVRRATKRRGHAASHTHDPDGTFCPGKGTL